MSLQIARGESVLKELAEEVFILRERDHAVADVARGEDVEVFAEAAGGATVVGDGDDRGEIADGSGDGLGPATIFEAKGGVRPEDLRGRRGEALEATKQG
jgi:hypothetical protein